MIAIRHFLPLISPTNKKNASIKMLAFFLSWTVSKTLFSNAQ